METESIDEMETETFFFFSVETETLFFPRVFSDGSAYILISAHTSAETASLLLISVAHLLLGLTQEEYIWINMCDCFSVWAFDCIAIFWVTYYFQLPTLLCPFISVDNQVLSLVNKREYLGGINNSCKMPY